MTAVLLFLRRYWLHLVVLAGVLFLLWWVYAQGKESVQKDWDAAVARGVIEVAKLKEKQVVVTTKVETVYVDRVKTIREKGDAIEVVREVFVPADSGNIGGGFRLFYDATLTGAIPESASITDAAAIPLADLADTIAINHERCLIAYATTEGLQEWIREQQRLNP
jgi:hypothetical protein